MITRYFQPRGAKPTTSTPVPSTGNSAPHAYLFSDAFSVEVLHNLGRPVVAQVWLTDGQQIHCEICQLNLNSIQVKFSSPLTGTLLVL